MPARRSSLKLLEDPTTVRAQATLGSEGLDWAKVPTEVASSPDAHNEWRRLADEYRDSPTRFREGDRAALVAYCTSYALYLEASRHLTTEGLAVQGRSAPDRARLVKSPWLTIWSQTGTALRHWARECALTVDSRGRAGLVNDGRVDVDPGDPFD